MGQGCCGITIGTARTASAAAFIRNRWVCRRSLSTAPRWRRNPAASRTAGGVPAWLWVERRGSHIAGALLADHLPDAEFISPNAPFPCAQNPFGGFEWFGLEDRSAEKRLSGTRAAAIHLDAFLDGALRDRGLDESKLALVGFSPGHDDVAACGTAAQDRPRGDRRLFRRADRAGSAGDGAEIETAGAAGARHRGSDGALRGHGAPRCRRCRDWA